MTGKELKILRQKLGLSQTAFAEGLGLTMRSIQNYEASEKVPQSKVVLINKIYSLDENIRTNTKKVENTEDTNLSPQEVMNVIECIYLHEQELMKYPMFRVWVENKEKTARNKGLRDYLDAKKAKEA